MLRRQIILSHLGPRPRVELHELLHMFALPRLDPNVLSSALRVFSEEYGIEIGVLRPEDRIDVITRPVPTRNPLKWLFTRAAAEDALKELSYALKRQRKRLGLPVKPEKPIETIRDYVAAWAGLD
jgi:hypothetical protein